MALACMELFSALSLVDASKMARALVTASPDCLMIYLLSISIPSHRLLTAWNFLLHCHRWMSSILFIHGSFFLRRLREFHFSHTKPSLLRIGL